MKDFLENCKDVYRQCYNISNLLADLRRSKVLGKSADSFSFDLMWQGESAVLLRFVSNVTSMVQWVLVERTGKQYYKVIVLRSLFSSHYILRAHFRNSPMTTDYIKNLL